MTASPGSPQRGTDWPALGPTAPRREEAKAEGWLPSPLSQAPPLSPSSCSLPTAIPTARSPHPRPTRARPWVLPRLRPQGSESPGWGPRGGSMRTPACVGWKTDC